MNRRSRLPLYSRGPVIAFILTACFGGISLNRTYLVPGVSAADLLFGLGVATALAVMAMGRVRLVSQRWSGPLLLFILYGGLLGLALILLRSPYVTALEFTKSYSRLLFYGGGAVVLSSFLAHVEAERWKGVLLWILLFNSAVAIYIFAVQSLGLAIPYEFFWFGQDSPLKASFFRGVGLVRARGLFSEPSYFGIAQSLGLAVVLSKEQFSQLELVFLGVILVSVGLTFSLSAVALVTIVLGIHLLHQSRGGVRAAVRQGLLPALVLLAALGLSLTLPPVRLAVETTITGRLGDLASGADISGTARLLGSLDAAQLTVRRAPLTGFGIGGLGPALMHNQRLMYFGTMMVEQEVESWNILVYILGSMGVGGIILFALIFFRLWRTSSGAVVLFVSTFASGAFLGPIFWVPLALMGASPARGAA